MDIKVKIVVGLVVIVCLSGLLLVAYQLGQASKIGVNETTVSVTGEPANTPVLLIEAGKEASQEAEVVEDEPGLSPTVTASVSGKMVFPNLRIKPTATPTPTIGIKVELRQDIELMPIISPTPILEVELDMPVKKIVPAW